MTAASTCRSLSSANTGRPPWPRLRDGASGPRLSWTDLAELFVLHGPPAPEAIAPPGWLLRSATLPLRPRLASADALH